MGAGTAAAAAVVVVIVFACRAQWLRKQRKRSIQPEAAFPPKPQPPPVARAAEASVPATLVGQREIRFEVNDVFETAQRR
uniref:Uncharacterized protein n=1 Tax=Knipowitschia caucasica TaxID=637954 RepID=A0AAV2KPV7_KNICA